MRKATIISTSGLGLALLCSAVLGKEEPGSRMTFGQKMNSMFGLVDTASNTPPPAPPPNATNYNIKRPQHATVPTGGKQQSVQHGGAAAPKTGYTSGAVTPPTPRRDDGAAQTPPVPTEQALPNQPSSEVAVKPSILMQSRGAGAQAGGTVRAAPKANTTTASRPAATAQSNSAAPAANNPNTVPFAAGTNRAPGAPVMQSPVNTSRRRPLEQRTTTDPLTETEPTAANEIPIAAVPMGAAPTAKAAPSNDDVFIPSIPMMADRRASGGTVSGAPATLPVDTNDNASRPLVAAQPNTTSTPDQFDSSIPLATVPMATPPSTTARTTTDAESSGSGTSGSAVLAAFTSPEVTVETVGPRRISIGREAKYRIVVRNRGQAAAQQVVVSLNVPTWAEVVEMHGTSGNTTSADEHAANTPLQWQLDVLGARAEEELTLVLIPRKSETFDLGVRWTCSPAAVATAIEVEEPQLQMTIAGPGEVSYGEQRLYKLTVLNPGTGTAENVVLHLQPLSPNDGEAVSHKIGDLKAGQDTSVEVELTARQAGRLKIRTAASADGDLRTEASADVIVHRAALDVSVVAPKVVFAGVPGSYEVRVRNTGDDQARNVKLIVDLPQGTKLITAAPSQKQDGKANQATWAIERLAPGAEQVFSLRCSLESGGIQQLTATTSADGDLRKTAQASTDVQSVADLALDVIDTPGPVAVGQPVTYEIHVKNRGMKSAEGVDIVAYFSEGIEPEKAEGQAHELQPGMVVFKSLTTVGAGQDRVLRITARAGAAGNHRLRVEMHSRAPQTQLSHEDATFFYLDEAPSTTTSNSSGSGNANAEHARALRSTRATGNGSTSMNSEPTYTAPMNASPINAMPTTAAPAAASTTTTATPSSNPYATGSVGATAPATLNPTRASDNRYGSVEQAIPTTLPQSPDAVRPANSLGNANAPGTVYPAALPQRHRTNGLR